MNVRKSCNILPFPQRVSISFKPLAKDPNTDLTPTRSAVEKDSPSKEKAHKEAIPRSKMTIFNYVFQVVCPCEWVRSRKKCRIKATVEPTFYDFFDFFFFKIFKAF